MQEFTESVHVTEEEGTAPSFSLHFCCYSVAYGFAEHLLLDGLCAIVWPK